MWSTFEFWLSCSKRSVKQGSKQTGNYREKRIFFLFFQKSICGNYQLFFSNHDANLLWFYPGLIHHIIKELVYSSYIHVSEEQHKIMCELKSNNFFVLNCPLIRSDGFPIVLLYALLDGGWFVVGILIGGLFSNKWYFGFTRFSRTWCYRKSIF